MQSNSEKLLTEWLVLNAQSGKAAAIDQLLRIWYPKFLRYSEHQLRDREAARDVVQETLLTIARKITSLKDPAAFPKWAYQILHRRGVDNQRKDIRRRQREVSEENPDTFAAEETNNERRDETDSMVRVALKSLDELSYNVIHLFYLHGLSQNQIATVCSIPVGTVKSRLHNARGKLRHLLETKL